MTINSVIIEAAARYATTCLTKDLGKEFLFHNLSHTLSVVRSAELICAEMKISNAEKKLVMLAAWFHDLGYTQKDEEHEKAGAAIAEYFLRQQDVDETDIETITQCILATHYPQQPLTVLQMILCDADMMHLAGKKYQETAEVLRKEWEATKGKSFGDKEWYDLNISFLNGHRFHTSYGQSVLEKGKQKNIRKLVSLVDAYKKEANGMGIVLRKKRKIACHGKRGGNIPEDSLEQSYAAERNGR